jgi:hypothetical protein
MCFSLGRWEDNIEVDLREKGREVVDWIYVNHDKEHLRALVNTVMNFRVPEKAGYFLNS